MDAFCAASARCPSSASDVYLCRHPHVLADNYQGMRDAVSHLIEHHGYRRIAFLRGPKGAQEEVLRFRAAYARYALRPWPAPDGRTHLRPHELGGAATARPPSPSFWICAGYGPGLILKPSSPWATIWRAALATLQARYLRAEDVAVVGFNDDDEGRAILQALTHRPAARGTDGSDGGIDADGAARRATSGRVGDLSLELVVRRSCGCLSPGVLHAQ